MYMHWLAALLCYLFLSSSFVISKLLILEGAHPAVITTIRMLFAGIVQISLSSFFNTRTFPILKQFWKYILLLATISFSITYIINAALLKYMNIGAVSTIYGLTPFISGFLSYLMLNEVISIKQIGGIFIGFLGVVLPSLLQSYQQSVISSSISNAHFDRSIFIWESTLILILFASITAIAFGWIIIRKLHLHHKGITSIVVGWSTLIGGIISGISTIIIDPSFEHFLYVVANPYLFALSCVYSIFANLIGYNLYTHCIQFFSATIMGMLGSINLITDITLAWFILNETIHWVYIVFLPLRMLGLYIFLRYQRQSKTIKK